MMRLFHHVLTSYFGFSNKFYEQTDGLAVGLSLTPVVTNFFMQDFGEVELDWAPSRPVCWCCYVDHTLSSGTMGLTNCENSLTT
jgi:hypothetical protein